MTKVRALEDNEGHWVKGEVFEVQVDDGDAYIKCHYDDGWHFLLDGQYRNIPIDKLATCPDFEVIP